jgi:hypothetical protein
VSVVPLSITIASVLTEDDLEKRDLKPQASLPKLPVWPWLLLGVLVAALLFFVARWLLLRWRRRSEVESEAGEPVDDRFPEVIAHDELDRIAVLDLPTRGAFKRHYTLVADCLRTYLEGVYDIPAMDRTTGELTTMLRRVWVAGDAFTPLRTLLEEADLVKFAKSRPSVERARAIIVQARHIVDVTKPDRIVTNDGAQAPAAQHGVHNM